MEQFSQFFYSRFTLAQIDHIELLNLQGINCEAYTCLYLNGIIYILFLDNLNSTNLIICTGCQER